MTFNPEVNQLLKLDLSEILQDMMDFACLIDDNYQNLSNNNLMRYWQAKNVTLKSVLLADLSDWLCCLAFSDGFIAPEEVEFINNYLKQDLSADTIIELCKFRIDQDYFKNLPLSFVLLYEYDLIMKSMKITEDINSVELLYKLFMIIGVQFIYCDDDVYLDELSTLNRYCEDLSKRINDFDLIQSHLKFLEMSDGKFMDEYFENRYPFSKDIINDYTQELNELGNIEELNEEIHKINFSPWMIEPAEVQANLWESSEIKTSYSWNLEKNINAYYDFKGQFDNHFVDIGEITTLEFRQKLEDIHLTPQQYQSILNKIKSTSDNILYKLFNENYLDFNSLNLFEKILLFTKSFVDTEYKSSGEQLGVYSFNRIHLDDRVYSSYQIITLIHELSHHLLAEIFEQAVMILLNTDKTDAVELYVEMSLRSSNRFVLLNEYCAHSVENHFTPKEYQNYGSFINVLEEFDLENENDKQVVLEYMLLGNTFCQDILTIIKPFIDNNFTEEIKQELKNEFKDMQTPEKLSFEIGTTLERYVLLDYINNILISGIDEALKNSET